MSGISRRSFAVNFTVKNPFSGSGNKIVFNRIKVKDDLYVIQSKQLDIHLSNAVLFDDDISVKQLRSPKIQLAIENELDFYSEMITEYSEQYMNYIDKFNQIHPRHKMAIIAAHALPSPHPNFKGGVWIYFGNEYPHSLQDWVNSNAKKYSTILIGACNPLSMTLKKSALSLLVIPDHFLHLRNLRNPMPVTWAMQFQGVEIDSLVIESELNYLNKLPPFRTITDMLDYFAFRDEKSLVKIKTKNKESVKEKACHSKAAALVKEIIKDIDSL